MPFASCFAAIVLLLDTSASVPDHLYVAQRDGTASAFETPRLVRAIEENGGIAVMVMEFGYVALVRMEWTVLRHRGDAATLAAAFRSLQRSGRNGNTAIGHAIARAHEELDAVPCKAQFRVIDVSTDGEETTPRTPARLARDAAAEAGITINAIAFPPQLGDSAGDAVATYLADAELWLRQNVANGFVRVATEQEGFAEAFRNKLIHELTELRASVGHFSAW